MRKEQTFNRNISLCQRFLYSVLYEREWMAKRRDFRPYTNGKALTVYISPLDSPAWTIRRCPTTDQFNSAVFLLSLLSQSVGQSAGRGFHNHPPSTIHPFASHGFISLSHSLCFSSFLSLTLLADLYRSDNSTRIDALVTVIIIVAILLLLLLLIVCLHLHVVDGGLQSNKLLTINSHFFTSRCSYKNVDRQPIRQYNIEQDFFF